MMYDIEKGTEYVFEYFEETKEYRYGTKKKPSLFIIITDGYFGSVDAKNKRYDKKVIWILQSDKDIARFKPGMGKVAKLMID